MAYDSFSSSPSDGWWKWAAARARRHVHQVLETDPSRMRTILLMIAELSPRREAGAGARTRRPRIAAGTRARRARPVLGKLRAYLREAREELLSKSEAGWP